MEICRLCFDSHSASFVLLNLENESPHRKQLGVVFPEINLEAVSVPYLCSNCSAALESAYMCKRTWLACEERLKRYMERNPDFPSYFISDIVKESALPESVVKIEDEYSEIAVKLEVDLSPGSPDPLDFETEFQDVEVKSEIEDDIEKVLVVKEYPTELAGPSHFPDTETTIYNSATEANRLMPDLIPDKSRQKYFSRYKSFMDWCAKRKVKTYTESVTLNYMSELSQKYKSSSLWSIYSMLKATMAVRHNIDIGRYPTVTAFLKKKSLGHVAQKSRTFTQREIYRFLRDAPDEIYLMAKVVLIIGVAGACRTEELTNMTVDNLKDLGNVLIMHVSETRNSKQRTFSVSNSDQENSIDVISICRKYFKLRPKNMDSRRLFVKYDKEKGRCVSRNVGNHTIGGIPRCIAAFLNLPHSDEYTGRCLRTTAATLTADLGTERTSKRSKKKLEISYLSLSARSPKIAPMNAGKSRLDEMRHRLKFEAHFHQVFAKFWTPPRAMCHIRNGDWL